MVSRNVAGGVQDDRLTLDGEAGALAKPRPWGEAGLCRVQPLLCPPEQASFS